MQQSDELKHLFFRRNLPPLLATIVHVVKRDDDEMGVVLASVEHESLGCLHDEELQLPPISRCLADSVSDNAHDYMFSFTYDYAHGFLRG